MLSSMGAGELILLALAVFAGAAAQRLTGMGFALVSAPLLTLLLGTMTGVTVVQVLGMAVSGALLISVWRDVDWRTLIWILIPAFVAIVPGVFVVRALPGPMLEIVIGLLVVIALLAVVMSERAGS